MYNKQKGVFVGLTLKLYPTGKIPPKYSFKGSRVNMWKCSITKKNFRGTESWESSNHILPYIREGYSGNYYGKTEPLENPKGYEKGDEIFVINPDLCTECVGFHGDESCQIVCPVECCIPDFNNRETEEELLNKAINMHPNSTFPDLKDLDDTNSRFRNPN